MAHYALIDKNNIVTLVFVGKDETEGDWETHYSDDNFQCKRTSYNTQGGIHLLGGTPFRKNYASIGYTYDKTRDAFIPPQPYPSWLLNDNSCLWEPPTPQPDNGEIYLWDEQTTSWVQT